MLNKRFLVLIFLLVFLPLVGCLPSPVPSNQAPIIISIPITAVTVGETYVYNVEATDPDGDILTYSLITKPMGMTINPATGLIGWPPKAEGNYVVVVKVSDGALDITQSFTIVVSKPYTPPPVNHAPIITSIPNHTSLTTIVGVEYIYEVKATDPDGDVLTYSLIANPSGMAIDSSTGKVTWMPESTGSYGVTVKVSDGKKFTTQSFTITVKAVEPDPEIELTGIKVDPKKMTLFVGESEAIKSVTATYEIRGSEIPIALGDCTYLSSDIKVAKVEKDNFDVVNVKAEKEGTATIIVSYGGKIDTIEVTVIDLVHNINQETYYHTIQVAVNKANPGDTIEVEVGTYNEAVLIDKQLTLNGTNASESIIDGGETTAITISADDVTIDGFTLDGGITLDDRANPVSGGTISNNIITGADNSAEPIKAQNGIRLGWYDGMGVDYITIENNIIIDSWAKGIRFANPTEGSGTSPGNSYITIRNNEIKDNDSAGMETYGPGFNIITGNTISGNDGNGINLKFDDGDVVTGNTITNNTGPGITLRQVTNTVVENNSVSDHQSEVVIKSCPSVIGGKGSGIHIFDVSENNTIRFNDISGNNYGIFVHSKVLDDGTLLQPSDNSINSNNIYGNSYYGILNDLLEPTIPVDAEDNWWGIGGTDENAGEPGVDGNNHVSTNVDYIPWSTSKF